MPAPVKISAIKLSLLGKIAAVALRSAPGWPAPPSPRGPDLALPVIVLDLEPAKPEVGQEVSVSWLVVGRGIGDVSGGTGIKSLPTPQ